MRILRRLAVAAPGAVLLAAVGTGAAQANTSHTAGTSVKHATVRPQTAVKTAAATPNVICNIGFGWCYFATYPTFTDCQVVGEEIVATFFSGYNAWRCDLSAGEYILLLHQSSDG